VVIIAVGLFVALRFPQPAAAQNAAAQGNVLTFGDNFFVTGDYAIGGAVLGKSNSGFVTGTISIDNDQNPGVKGTNKVPLGAEIVAALLYWQEIEIVGGATGQNGFFRPVFNGGPQTGYPIKGTILKNPNGIVYWDGSGCASSKTPKQLVTYRQEVRAFLRQDAQGNVIANGQYEVVMPSQSNGSPLTVGVSLVIIYRVLSPNFPLNSIVIYDGTPASALTTTQIIQGFYDAAANVSKLTYIAGNGRKNLSETVSLDGTALSSLYPTLPPFPGWYGTWDNPTWFFDPATNDGASSATTTVVSAHQGCITPAAIIYSTTVKDSSKDGLLDVWKLPKPPNNPLRPGYCDASVNEGVCNQGDANWVDLPGAKLNQRDVFVQLDYMCSSVTGPDSCDTSTSFANPLSAAASAAPDGTTAYTGVFSPTFPLNTFITITGFTNPQNNGNFIVVSNTGNQLVVNNASGVAEAHAGSATFKNYSFDPRPVTDSITGANSFDEVNTAYFNKGITLHAEWHAMAETAACTDTVVSGIPSYCPYLNQPGLVGWKGGFDALKGQPLNYPDESSCEQAPLTGISGSGTGPCVRRFQHGRKDSYHEVIFAHAQGGPEWSFQGGTLTTGALCPAGTACVAQVGNTITFYTSTSHGLVVASGINDQNPLARVTVSDAITNTMLNGTYLVQNVTDKSFTIQVGFATNATYTPSTDPRLSVASGRIHTRSGFSDVGGADSLVTLGRWDPVLAQQTTGTTFMHEFGHANGLSHGGFYYDQLTSSNNNYTPTVEPNCKPNFQSVMNYPFQLNHLDNSTSKVVDYSEEQLDTLNEQSPPAGVTIDMNPPFYPNTLWFTPTKPSASASPAKFTCDGMAVPPGTTMYLIPGPADPISPGWINGQDIDFNLMVDTQLHGYSDWTNVDLRQVGATGADAFGGGGSLGPGGGSLGPGGGSLGPGGGSLGPGGGSLGPGGGSLGPGGGSLGPGGGSLGPGGGSLGPGGGVGGDEVDVTLATGVTYPPGDLTATEGASPRTITLNWTRGFGLIAFYKVYRSDDGGLTFNVIGTVNAPATTFIDNPACKLTGYQYFVSAVQSSSSPNPGSESGPSNIVSKGQNKEPLTGCYKPPVFSSPAAGSSPLQGSAVPITWTVPDASNNNGVTFANNPGSNSLVAIGPISNDVVCVSGSVPTNAPRSTISSAGTITFNPATNQFNFNWNTALGFVGSPALNLPAGAFPPGCYLLEDDLDSGQPTLGGLPASAFQVQIYLSDANESVQVSTTSLPSAAEGVAYSQTVQAQGDIVAPVNWTIVPGSGSLPPNLTLSAMGVLSGTPTTPGTYNFTVRATDSIGDFGTQALSLLVNAVVTNTLDSGPGSLRQAILDVHAAPQGPQPIAILFMIPAAGVQTITPLSALPPLMSPTILDATTQPGYAGTPLIELNGSNAGTSATGIHVTAGNSTVRGLVIDSFNGDGIQIDTNGGNVVQGNYVGTNPAGTQAAPNTGNGIQIIAVPNNTIGGGASAMRNIISGNSGEGVRIDGTFATGNIVRGNYIGTDVTGSNPVGNNASGIFIRRAPGNSVIGNVVSGNLGFAGVTICGSTAFCGGGDISGIDETSNANANIVQGNLVGTSSSGTAALGNSQAGLSIDGAPNTAVGGTAAGAANTISFNGTNDVQIFDPGASGNQIKANRIQGSTTAAGNVGINVLTAGLTGNTFSQNSISGHQGLGIDLAPAGVNPNTAGGFNNWPVISSAQASSGMISGALNGPANATFTIEFFSNTACNASGNGEGAVFLGSASVTTDGTGNIIFAVPVAGLVLGNTITATSTDAIGTTSEFSACVPVS
jgi:hypothetical protein